MTSTTCTSSTAASFVTGAAVNPTPTIQAMALRVADHIRTARADLKSR